MSENPPASSGREHEHGGGGDGPLGHLWSTVKIHPWVADIAKRRRIMDRVRAATRGPCDGVAVGAAD